MNGVSDIVMTAAAWHKLRSHLLRCDNNVRSPDEQLAFVLASHNITKRGTRLVAHELLLAGEIDLAHQSSGGIAPTGEFVARALTRCRLEGWSLIEVHSHPFDSSGNTTFSGIDWANDRSKMPRLASMLPYPFFHATMVVGQIALDAHYYERETGAILPLGRLVVVGTYDGCYSGALQYLPFTTSRPSPSFTPNARHERQLPLIGSQTQEALSKAVVAVVGVGGLGSFVALELAYLGVGRLVLIDHDCVELTNLNRLIGAQESDVGRPKVEVFADLLNQVSPTAEVSAVHAPLMTAEALDAAKSADLLLGCVDSHGARLVLNHLAIRYLIPYLDAGTGVRLGEDGVQPSVGGQVQLVAPGVGCLECRGFINPQRAAFDLATPEMQEYERSHGYGTQEAAPSVVSLNGVVASMQVAEAVRLLTVSCVGAEGGPRMILYDALAQRAFTATSGYSGECATCGFDGVSGVADLAPLQAATSSTHVVSHHLTTAVGEANAGTVPDE